MNITLELLLVVSRQRAPGRVRNRSENETRLLSLELALEKDFEPFQEHFERLPVINKYLVTEKKKRRNQTIVENPTNK